MNALLTRAVRRPRRLLWLWAVWMVLWGRPSVLAAVSGVLVAAVVLVFFPFREIDTDHRFRPLGAARLLGHLIIDLVPSALAVAGQMIRTGPRTRAAIVAVPLRTSSEVVAALTANAVSLAPGAFVLEIDQEASVLYVYALVAERPGAVERVRADVLDLERRVLQAFGSDADADADAEPRAGGGRVAGAEPEESR